MCSCVNKACWWYVVDWTGWLSDLGDWASRLIRVSFDPEVFDSLHSIFFCIPRKLSWGWRKILLHEQHDVGYCKLYLKFTILDQLNFSQ